MIWVKDLPKDNSYLPRPGPAATPKPIPTSVHGYMGNHELVWLWETAKALGDLQIPGDILEIGSYRGLSTCALVQAGHMDCVDTFTDSFAGGDTEAEFYDNIMPFEEPFHVKVHRGKSEEVLKTLQGPYRMVLVDGDHSFKGAVRDIQLSYPLLSPGGFIVLDDYYPYHVFWEVKPAVEYCGLGLLALVSPFYSKMGYRQKPIPGDV